MAIRSKKAQEEREQRIRRWVIIGGLSLCALFLAFVVVIHQPFLRIQYVTVEGNESIFAEDIADTVVSMIATKKVFFFPRDTVFWYPKDIVRDVVKEKFSRIASIHFERKNFNDLIVRVREHAPQYLWCTEDNHCYFMDDSSYIFARAPYFSDHVYQKFEGAHFDIAGDPLRQQVLRAEAFEQLNALTEQFEDEDIFLKKITALEYSDYKLSLESIKGSQVGAQSHILINLSYPIEKTVEMVRLAFEQESFQEKLDTQPENLHYIDVRFEGKIVYRFDVEDANTQSLEEE